MSGCFGELLYVQSWFFALLFYSYSSQYWLWNSAWLISFAWKLDYSFFISSWAVACISVLRYLCVNTLELHWMFAESVQTAIILVLMSWKFNLTSLRLLFLGSEFLSVVFHSCYFVRDYNRKTLFRMWNCQEMLAIARVRWNGNFSSCSFTVLGDVSVVCNNRRFKNTRNNPFVSEDSVLPRLL